VYESVGYIGKYLHFMNKITERRAEVNVFRKELDIRMIKQSIQLISTEHSSLLSTFEIAATDKDIHAFIHP
jgi:hypothetical protein